MRCTNNGIGFWIGIGVRHSHRTMGVNQAVFMALVLLVMLVRFLRLVLMHVPRRTVGYHQNLGLAL